MRKNIQNELINKWYNRYKIIKLLCINILLIIIISFFSSCSDNNGGHANTNELIEKALDSINNEKYERALELLLQAEQNEPKNAEIHAHKTLLFALLEKEEECNDSLNLAISFGIDESELAFMAGREFYFVKGNLDIAGKFFAQSHEASKDNPFKLINLGYEYKELGLLQEAFEEFVAAYLIFFRNPQKRENKPFHIPMLEVAEIFQSQNAYDEFILAGELNFQLENENVRRKNGISSLTEEELLQKIQNLREKLKNLIQSKSYKRK